MGRGPCEAQANGTVTTRVTGGLYAKQGMYVTNTVVTQQGTQNTIVFENDSSMTGVRMSEGTARKLYAELQERPGQSDTAHESAQAQGATN
jgi:hypothetical protein